MFRPSGSIVLPFLIKKASLALRMESRWEKFFRWGLTVPQPLFWYFSMGSRRKTKHANIHLDHSSVINLSSCSLSTDEISILSRGLTFSPVRGLRINKVASGLRCKTLKPKFVLHNVPDMRRPFRSRCLVLVTFDLKPARMDISCTQLYVN